MQDPISETIINQGTVLSSEQLIPLCKEFTDKEIKEVLFSIPNIKSPGPDGFNNRFYKTAWHKIGPLVCNAIKEFFRAGVMPGL